ncbi:hypothetical protein EIP91_008758 [Steccherinum ochraceum]|uniref:Serine protease inhibitor n=1 Tax=Steccherinum ochraceum TaxID=92696 RepID=A0A4R0RN82_9APHY|nr:hypothetical protein EIP91_008758 [Steccherinum ochraceum]
MSLESGTYIIINHQHEGFVSRARIEDRSGLPKPVFVLPVGVQPTGKWRVDKTSEGKYVLSALGSPTGYWERDGTRTLYAFLNGPLDENARPVDWTIREVDTTTGRYGYIVETTLPGGEKVGWSTDDVPTGVFGIHIAVKPLVSTRSEPPQFLPSDVFQFERVKDD